MHSCVSNFIEFYNFFFRKFTTVSIDIYPSTADKLDEQYVRMTLQFILNEEVNDF